MSSTNLLTRSAIANSSANVNSDAYRVKCVCNVAAVGVELLATGFDPVESARQSTSKLLSGLSLGDASHESASELAGVSTTTRRSQYSRRSFSLIGHDFHTDETWNIAVDPP
jgi:hypothetical protein